MNLEQYATPATIEAIYKYYKDKRKNDHRPHLGGSQIGNECSRALWYQFRHAWSPRFDGRMLRLFETGDREEDRIVSNLRGVGVTVWERDPETGKQVRFTECGGHFALSLDGVICLTSSTDILICSPSCSIINPPSRIASLSS